MKQIFLDTHPDPFELHSLKPLTRFNFTHPRALAESVAELCGPVFSSHTHERRCTVWCCFEIHTHTHMYCVVLFETLTHTLTHTFRPPRSSRRPRFDLVQKAVASDKASHRPLTLAQVARPATSLKRPEPLTSSNGAAAALNLNGGARRKPPLSQLGPAALAGHYEIRQLRLHSMQIAVLFVRSCAASHSPLNHSTS